MSKKNEKSAGGQKAALQFTKVNAMLGLAGLACLALGYALLARGSITAAPLLLVLAYVVLIPMAIIK
jgi:fatty acid desaturase